jgi:hypothetical protein
MAKSRTVGKGKSLDAAFKIERTYESVKKGIKKEVMEGLIDSAQKILDRARELAPKETGALRASGKLQDAKGSVLAKGRAGGGRASQTQVKVVFGGALGPDADNHWDRREKNLTNGLVLYAAAVHANHPTNALFLLQAEQELGSEVFDEVRKRTSNVIRHRGRAFKK